MYKVGLKLGFLDFSLLRPVILKGMWYDMCKNFCLGNLEETGTFCEEIWEKKKEEEEDNRGIIRLLAKPYQTG